MRFSLLRLGLGFYELNLNFLDCLKLREIYTRYKRLISKTDLRKKNLRFLQKKTAILSFRKNGGRLEFCWKISALFEAFNRNSQVKKG